MPRGVAIMLLSIACLTQAMPGAQGRRPPPRDTATGNHPPVTPGDRSGCAACHAEVMTHRVMHGPAASGACDSCHVLAETSGRRVFTLASGARRDDTKALCLTCHEEVGRRMNGAHLHAPVAGGHCTSCHDPHGSAFRFQLPSDGDGACLTCHVDVAQALGQAFPHAPAASSCTMCHDAHAANFRSQLRGSVNTVCLACHLEVRESSPAADLATLFGKTLGVHETDLVATASKIRLDVSRRSGHPNRGHPVENAADPVGKGRELNCASCHNPHGTNAKKLLRFDATGISSLCIRCHQL